MPRLGLQTPGEAPSTGKLVVRFDPSDYVLLARAAEELDLSMSAFVRYLVRRHVASPQRRKEQSPGTQALPAELRSERAA
jgi:hypothetical protein